MCRGTYPLQPGLKPCDHNDQCGVEVPQVSIHFSDHASSFFQDDWFLRGPVVDVSRVGEVQVYPHGSNHWDCGAGKSTGQEIVEATLK